MGFEECKECDSKAHLVSLNRDLKNKLEQSVICRMARRALGFCVYRLDRSSNPPKANSRSLEHRTLYRFVPANGQERELNKRWAFVRIDLGL